MGIHDILKSVENCDMGFSLTQVCSFGEKLPKKNRQKWIHFLNLYNNLPPNVVTIQIIIILFCELEVHHDLFTLLQYLAKVLSHSKKSQVESSP